MSDNMSNANTGDGAGQADGMDEQIRTKLLPHIQNAYALENQVAEALERHRDEAAGIPEMQAKIQEHFEVTKQHRERIVQRLQAYGETPSVIKDLGSSLMGNMMGAMAGMRPDTMSRMARDEYVSEHLEIAAYTLLITTAQALGDMETVRIAEQNLQDEIEMQQWLLSHMPQVCLYDLQQEGYTVMGNA